VIYAGVKAWRTAPQRLGRPIVVNPSASSLAPHASLLYRPSELHRRVSQVLQLRQCGIDWQLPAEHGKVCSSDLPVSRRLAANMNARTAKKPAFQTKNVAPTKAFSDHD